MDRIIYTSMTGANAAAHRQAVLSNNLANISTHGFRAEMSTFRSVPIQGEGSTTRVFALEATSGHRDTPGPVQRAMIVALGDEEHVKIEKEIYRERREVLLDAVRAYGFRLAESQAGLYLWATLGESCWNTVDRMAELGIVVVPGTFYGQHSTDYVRFSITATDDKIAEGARRLRDAIGL